METKKSLPDFETCWPDEMAPEPSEIVELPETPSSLGAMYDECAAWLKLPLVQQKLQKRWDRQRLISYEPFEL